MNKIYKTKSTLKAMSKHTHLLLLLFCLSFGTMGLMAQNSVTVRGTVISSTDNEPVIGAYVTQVGTTNGTITNIDGEFTITVPSNSRLVFSYIGYVTQTVDVAGRTSLAISMVEDFVGLDEVVVVGFASQRRVNLTGAITVVGAEQFENRPVSNIGQALQGVVPNLNVTISSGAPNTIPNFNIRGGTSLGRENNEWVVQRGSPLILVDGVEYSAELLNQMNPNDIESMTVIKDASAAAIYGTRATYGVMLITTKSGKFNQRGKVSYSYDLSFDSPSALPDILDAVTLQEASMNRTRWRSPGGTVASLEERKLEAMKNYMANPTPENAWIMEGNQIIWVANMNPYDLLVRRSAPTQKHNLNVSGGSDRISYFFSFGYQTEEGLYKINNDEFNRYNVMMRVNAKVTDRFNMEGRFNYNRTTYEHPYLVGGKGNLWAAMRNETNKNINMPLMTGPNDPMPNVYTDNILSWLSYGARATSLRQSYAMSISPSFTILPGVLTARADLSFTPSSVELNRRSPRHQYITTSWTTIVSEQAEAQDNRARLETNRTESYLVNAYLDFGKTFAEKHRLSSVFGFSQEYLDYRQMVIDLRGLFSPDIQNPNAAEDRTLHTQSVGAYRRTARGVFGRVNYTYDNKYMLEMNTRYDGSSRFTPRERFVFFPSFSAGWNISQEGFMEFAQPVLSHMKLRGSWGRLGSQPGGNYPYQETMSTGSANYIFGGKLGTQVEVPGLVSPTLTWQKATTTNFGVETHFLKGRLQAEFDIYRRKVTDILIQGEIPYPDVLGAAAPLMNSGELESYGWELSLNWRERLPNGITYRAGLVLSDERTKVLSFAGNPNKLLTTLYDGMYTGNIWGYETGGILQESDLRPNPSTPGAWLFDGPQAPGSTFWPGDLWYKDLNGDGIINQGDNTLANPGDRKLLGNNSPRYRFGITGDIAYKGFDLNVFFQGIGKRDLWIGSNAYWGGGAGSRWMYDRSWQPDRTDAKFPMYGATPSVSSAYIINGAYLRLKQAVLSYTLPQDLTRKIGVERVRFSVSGFNIFDITAIPNMFDPDQISDEYPQKRTMAFGAQISF
ncbi:MAG: TonB-dependent receptor [Dysgonamonadaceae bacterium]|jgi:TonB-linked SusC/RagA family outer membrane protein|nr:TonB-dependent receptor [Dysgonamonadaceae bacterium]